MELFRESLRASIYNNPEMRTDIDAREENFVPATDFSEVFRYTELTENSVNLLADEMMASEHHAGSGGEILF